MDGKWSRSRVFCWVPVPYLTMVIRSVAFYMTILFAIYSLKKPKKKKKKLWIVMWNSSPKKICPSRGSSTTNYNRHRVDGAMVSAGSLPWKLEWTNSHQCTSTSAMDGWWMMGWMDGWMDDDWIHNTFPLGSSSPNQLWWLTQIKLLPPIRNTTH
jgi:hypothetical protein